MAGNLEKKGSGRIVASLISFSYEWKMKGGTKEEQAQLLQRIMEALEEIAKKKFD